MFTSEAAKIDRQQLAAQADKLDGTIKQLIAMRDGLRHASHCSEPSHFECDKFQRLLGIALKIRRRAKIQDHP